MTSSTERPTLLRQLSLFALAAVTFAASVRAGDWPQFLGPRSDATSSEKGLLRSWPSDGPKVLWTVPLGRGYGGAAIFEGKVYVLDRIPQQKDVLRCLDLSTGKEDWTYAYDAPGRVDHDGSRSTPAVTEKHIFTIGPFGHLHCLDRQTHQVVWKKNILQDYSVKLPQWGVAQSPILYKDMVMIAPQSSQAGVAALDQATGKERWHSRQVGTMAYGSPLLLTLAGVEQFVIVTPEGSASVSAADGTLLWQFAHPCGIPVPNVTSIGEDKLFVTGGYGAGSAVFQVTRSGDRWGAKLVGSNDQIGGHCHPALLHQDHLYVLCNVNERTDGMVCFDKQAKLVWQTRNQPSLDKGGSLLTGDGLIYVVDGRSGELHIIEPSPQGFKSLGATKLLKGREIWGPLALANGKLVLRDQSQMKCVDLQTR